MQEHRSLCRRTKSQHVIGSWPEASPSLPRYTHSMFHDMLAKLWLNDYKPRERRRPVSSYPSNTRTAGVFPHLARWVFSYIGDKDRSGFRFGRTTRPCKWLIISLMNINEVAAERKTLFFLLLFLHLRTKRVYRITELNDFCKCQSDRPNHTFRDLFKTYFSFF